MIKKILLIISIVYLLSCSYLYVFQENLIFPSYTVDFDKFEIQSTDIEELTIKTNDKKTLNGVIKNGINPNILILYFGGNADDPREFTTLYPELEEYDIVTFNYRGYGKSDGTPSEKTLFEDALKIYDEYSQNKDVIIIGRSLGSGVATYLASQRDAKGLILITPYDSIVSVAQNKYFFVPVKYLIKHKFESTKYIKELNLPIAIIEVANDTTVPNIHTQNLIKEIKNDMEHTIFTNTTHGDVLNHPDIGLLMSDFIGRLNE